MKVHIIGVGPGSSGYVLPIARIAIEGADCLVGAGRLLALFRDLGKEEIRAQGDLSRVIAYTKKYRSKKKIAILVSGDPGVHSLLGGISKVLNAREYTVIPGISTVQLAFARIGVSWNDARIISLHGRRIGHLAREIGASAKAFLLTDPDMPPNKIAENLLKEGMENRRAVVLENLSYPNEKIIDTDLKRLEKMKTASLCVMIIMNDDGKSRREARLYGIGIGPGDPGLITLKAKEALDKVDIVFVPKSSEDGTSLARSIVESVTAADKTFVELTFPMTKDKVVLARYWTHAANIIAKEINKGRSGAFVTLGDPSLYSTYAYLLKTMRRHFPRIKVETIPGVSAFNAAASAVNLSLTEGRERLAVVPVTKDLTSVRKALEDFDTVVLMKVGEKLDSVISLLKQKGLLKRAILVSRVGHKDEKIVRDLSRLHDKKAGYLSVIIVKKGAV